MANEVDKIDRISELPDDMLCLIVSKLSTIEAFRTSILSKRWKNIWKSIPCLFFHCMLSPDDMINVDRIREFEAYVDNVVQSSAPDIVIDWCTISCHVSYRIPVWIRSLVTRHIKELTTSMESSTAVFRLPRQLFRCSTLTSLNLLGGFYLDFPADANLPNLKKLQLSTVVYSAAAIEDKFFSCFPSLEELTIYRCEADGARNMRICVPSLKKLYLTCLLFEEFLGYDYRVAIDTPKLEFLQLDDEDLFSVGYSICHLDSLVEAHFDELLPHNFVERISMAKDLKLVHQGLPVSFCILIRLLESSPNLEALVFKEGLVRFQAHRFIDFNWVPPASAPSCLLWTLKMIEINNFVGRECELHLTEFFLDHGRLEKMIFRCHKWIDFRGQQPVRDKILSFQKGPARHCQIDFEECLEGPYHA